MKNYEATEQAYKNGYEHGKKDALNKEQGRMTFIKPPEWGSRFQFPENLEINFDDLQMRVTDKIVVQMMDNYESAVAAEIASAARAAGVSDVTVLNKEAILDALNKQIPKKPADLAKCELYGHCAVCGKLVHIGERYCDQCGQALDWSTDLPKE